MADANVAPRRVSMAYILGFSNKPFKDGGPPTSLHPPRPRHPGAFKQMITTPGGVIEWTASDGRRGRLTGPGKPRLTATNLALVPSEKMSIKAASKKSTSKKSVSNKSEPKKSISNKSEPKKSVSNKSASKKSTSKKSTSNKDGAEESASKKDAVEESAPKKDAVEESTSKKDAVEESSSKKDDIEESASKKDAVDEPASKKDSVDDSASKKDAVNESKSKKKALNKSASKKKAVNESASKKDAADESVSKKDAADESVSKKDPAEESTSKEDPAEENIGGLFGGELLEDAPAVSAKDDTAKEEKPTESDWTDEQDKKLMELRNETPNAPWADVAKELNKKDFECKDRFKQIKPKDWKPGVAQNKAGGGKQKQGKQKQGKQKGEKNQKAEVKKEESKKDEVSGDGLDTSADNNWGGNWNTTDGAADGDSKENTPGEGDGDNTGWGGADDNTGWGGGDNKSEKKDDNDGIWGEWAGEADTKDGDKKEEGEVIAENTGCCDGKDSGGNNATDAGGTTGSGDRDRRKAGNDGNQGNDKASNKGSSKKGSSNNHEKSGSEQRSSRRSDKPTPSAPIEYELKPDSTFSADDLRIVAKILQQDCQMVWNRVSWRFKDKTGRNLHPEVFEKKITGKVEEKGSEFGRG